MRPLPSQKTRPLFTANERAELRKFTDEYLAELNLHTTITDIADDPKWHEPIIDINDPVLCPVCSAVWYRTGVEGHNHVCNREDFGPFARPQQI